MLMFTFKLLYLIFSALNKLTVTLVNAFVWS